MVFSALQLFTVGKLIRNYGNPEIAAAVIEGIKVHDGIKDLYKMLQQDYKNLKQFKNYGDPVLAQIIKAIQLTNTDIHNSTWSTLVKNVKQAVKNGVPPEQFAGLGGLNFGVKQITRLMLESISRRICMSINNDSSVMNNYLKCQEGTALVQAADGQLTVVTIKNGQVITQNTDMRNPSTLDVRDFNGIDWVLNFGKEGLETVTKGTLSTVSAMIEGYHGFREWTMPQSR